MLDDLGLADAAGWLVEDFARRSGIECRIDLAPREALDALERNLAVTLYRVLQESLTNVARHARASRVEVVLAKSDGALTLSVRDDGRGFSPAETRAQKTYGLLGLRERTVLLGGEASIASEPGRGTTINVRLPLQPEAASP